MQNVTCKLFHNFNKIAPVLFATIIGMVIILVDYDTGAGKNVFQLSVQVVNRAEKKYGIGARRRLADWVDLINSDEPLTQSERLRKVNNFFNRMRFIDDRLHWQQEDYWATPVEFLSSRGGDCEDYSIAKYFTLTALGVPEEKLNLTYVKALKLNQAHMVLTYYERPDADPLVLDNLINEIKPASQRKDLLPVYSFNGSNLWLAKQRGRGKLVGSSDSLKRWADLLKRMEAGFSAN